MWGAGIKLGLVATLIMSVWLHGAYYGPPARKLANREAEDRARNAVLTDMAERETVAGNAEDAAHAVADQEFDDLAPGLQKCILDAATAAALNLVRE